MGYCKLVGAIKFNVALMKVETLFHSIRYL